MVEAARQVSRRILVAASVVAIAAVDWASPDTVSWHRIVVRLYYFPVVLACLFGGWRTGLAVAGLSSLVLMAPVMFAPGTSESVLDRAVEAVTLICVAVVTGVIADRERRQKQQFQKVAEQLSAVYAKLQENFEGMKRAERLSAIGQLSAGLAHEIRNPLASISGAASILQRSENLDAKGARCLDIITKEAERLNGLLTSFLNFARPRAPRLQLIELYPVLENVAALAAHASRARTNQIATRISDRLPRVECDPEQLEQVLLNLVINAIEASPDGEPVTIAAEPAVKKVWIRIIDQGCGVAPNDIDRLFDPFFTTKENGTGLGLSVAHQIVRRMGGSLLAQRNDDKGMTFSVVLPAKSEEQ
jgi:signal transduction histidine kinase